MKTKFLPQNQEVIIPIPNVTTSNVTTSMVGSQSYGMTNAGSGHTSAPLLTTKDLANVNQSMNQSRLLQIEKTIKQLVDSQFNYYLGGSRSMWKRGAKVIIDATTDYDFYSTWSEENEDFLRSIGFNCSVSKHSMIACDYFDDEVVSIYKREKIDVVLRKDAEFYKKVFDNIKTDQYVQHLWKCSSTCDRSKIRLIMNELFKLTRNNEFNVEDARAEHIKALQNTPMIFDENIPF